MLRPLTLADYTRDALCLAETGTDDIAGVLATLSRALEREAIAPSLSLFSVALNRYFLSDGQTLGAVAYCVGRLPSIRCSQFAVARLPGRGLSPASASAHLTFLLATPADEPHVETVLIGGLKRLVNDPVTLGLLRAAPSGRLMRAALDRIVLDAAGDRPAHARVIPDGVFAVSDDQGFGADA